MRIQFSSVNLDIKEIHIEKVKKNVTLLTKLYLALKPLFL